MKMNFLKPFDVAITFMVCAAITVLSIKVYSSDNRPSAVNVKSESDLIIYPLSENRRLEVEGPLGVTVIEIADEHVRIASSPCRDKLCIIKGPLHKNGHWTACMPNLIYVTIHGKVEEGLDELSY